MFCIQARSWSTVCRHGSVLASDALSCGGAVVLSFLSNLSLATRMCTRMLGIMAALRRASSVVVGMPSHVLVQCYAQGSGEGPL